MKMILGKKLEMTRIFDKDSQSTPVTFISAGPCFVTKISKSADDQKNNLVQIGYVNNRHAKKPQMKQFKGNKDLENLKHFKEYIVELGELNKIKVGNAINSDIFKKDELVEITGISKGKGFAGTVKRHHFHRGPKTHGSRNYLKPGSIGCRFPQRVIKGRRMPGHLGSDQITTKNIKIIDVISDKNILVVKGCIPGSRNTLLVIRGK